MSKIKKNNEHLAVYRKDYLPPPYLVDEIDLFFRLDPEKTRVDATSRWRLNPEYPAKIERLVLNGEKLKLITIEIDGTPLTENDYALNEKNLEILHPPEKFELHIVTEINPRENSALSGLYMSGSKYCTQCEAEGFRRITYYLDRPDVLARFTTRIEADAVKQPVLLSNGNLLEAGSVNQKRHFSLWRDPYPKPSYLFALVAGNLVSLVDSYVTKSGRNVALEIYVEQQNRLKCDHAMRSLKNAMKWDEDVFGLEYDLEKYMIVAVDDFNMGAMENKGLNVFNSKYVLASPESATDQDYLGIEGVIGHEYFHNWTGNRVTCRDWFQLSLKEGLTVFRDQEFTASMNSPASKRIEDVRVLRNIQFREDSGPMAHPVRPDTYMEINNFYTVTIYNKGAEVIRMMHRLLGKVNFRKGMDLYFQRFDGQAVTCDDFVQAMSDASTKDLEQFKLWYEQSGTPVLSVKENWLSDDHTYTLEIEQTSAPTPGQLQKRPFHIPVDIGLLPAMRGANGKWVKNGAGECRMLELKKAKHFFSFSGFTEKPVLSFLRGFTAPVKIKFAQPRQELAFLMAQDDDLFNRWDAAVRLATGVIVEIVQSLQTLGTMVVDPLFVEAFRHSLLDDSADKALIALALTLPTETYIAQQLEKVEPANVHRAVEFVRATIKRELKEELRLVYFRNLGGDSYTITPEDVGRRSLKNCCLSYLMAKEEMDRISLDTCLAQFTKSTNMTDTIAALSALSHYPGEEREDAFVQFYQKWKDDSLVLDKWFMLQATSSLESTLLKIRELMNHEAFSVMNPNKVRSLIGAFCSFNHARFHDDTGAGYRFLTEQILVIDSFNSQIAARLASSFTSYRNYSQKLKVMMQEQLEFILRQENLSSDVYEIIFKCLNTETEQQTR